MPDLPARPDLDQLRHRAKDPLRSAGSDDAVAREYGFSGWARLEAEVQRREILDGGDADRLRALLAEHPQLSAERMEHWCDHPKGASPLGYVAMLCFDARRRGVASRSLQTGLMARALLDIIPAHVSMVSPPTRSRR